MGQEAMRSERYLVVARVTQRQLATFPARGWVVVEVFNDEASGRERLHQLRVPLEKLKLGAVLIRAMTTAGFERIAYEKTIISKDADFWDLQHSELLRATEPQQQEWNRTVEAVLAEAAAERKASLQAATDHRAARVRARSGQRQRSVAMAAGFATVLAVAGIVALSRQNDDAGRMVARSHNETMTVIIADSGNSRMLTEYALKPDGTRVAVRRVTREQVAAGLAETEPTTTAATATSPQKKSLVEALNGFFAVRE
jgi:hypothetical protein